MGTQNERLAYVSVLSQHGKSLFDILLDVIEAGCYASDFTSLASIDYNALSKDIFSRCGVSVPDYTLRIWIKNSFKLDGTKLVLKNDTEGIVNKMQRIKEREEEFNGKIGRVRDEFVEYCRSEFAMTPDEANKEWAKKVFDGYTFSVANNKSPAKNKDLKEDDVFMFRRFLRSLSNGDAEARSSLSVIEDYGVANQIQQLVSNRGNIDRRNNNDNNDAVDSGASGDDIADPSKDDDKFLDGCQVFVDTPLMMRFLGYDGRAMHEAYEKFFAALKKAGAVLRIFPHTFDEIYGILYAYDIKIAQLRFDAPGVGQFLRANREANGTLPLKRDDIKARIKSMGVLLDDSNERDVDVTTYPGYKEAEQGFLDALKGAFASGSDSLDDDEVDYTAAATTRPSGVGGGMMGRDIWGERQGDMIPGWGVLHMARGMPPPWVYRCAPRLYMRTHPGGGSI